MYHKTGSIASNDQEMTAVSTATEGELEKTIEASSSEKEQTAQNETLTQHTDVDTTLTNDDGM